MSHVDRLLSQGNGGLVLDETKSYARIPQALPLPNLIETQIGSYKWLVEEALGDLFEEISPIVSFNGKLEMYLLNYKFEDPEYTEEECRARDMTYGAPLHVTVRLKNNDSFCLY